MDHFFIDQVMLALIKVAYVSYQYFTIEKMNSFASKTGLVRGYMSQSISIINQL